MISVLQRVSSARVEVDGQTVGAIGPGLLVLVCAEQGDTLVDLEHNDIQDEFRLLYGHELNLAAGIHEEGGA